MKQELDEIMKVSSADFRRELSIKLAAAYTGVTTSFYNSLSMMAYTRECLATEVATSITSSDVILTLTRLMRLYGKPKHIRSDRGAEFTAARVMKWLRNRNVGPSFIPPSKPWHNGFVKSFNGKLRDERLIGNGSAICAELGLSSSPGASFTTIGGHTAHWGICRLRASENKVVILRCISRSKWPQIRYAGHLGEPKTHGDRVSGY